MWWFHRAGCSVLGRASNTEIYRPMEKHSKVRGDSYPSVTLFNAAVIWQRWWKIRQLCFSLSATRSLEWRYWHTMGLFIMGTETSSGRRWVGCWAWRQRRSAAGRRREKLWRNVKGKPPSTPWYERCRHWISSTDHISTTWVLIPFSILPSLFRKEASPIRHFLQRMSSLNLVHYEIVATRMFILIII